MKRFMKILGVVLALVLVFGAVGCALETPETGLGDRIVALENQIAGLEAAIANVSTADTSALSSELSALRDELGVLIASMEIEDQAIASQLVDLRHRIEALENGNGDGNGNGNGEPESETARWSYNAYVLSDLGADLTVSPHMVDMHFTIKPSTVEDEDVYEITLYLTNIYEPEDAIDVFVEFNFTPRHNAIVYVDEAHTYMDTTKYPYTLWDVEVYEKGDDKHTTRISCYSDQIHLPYITIGENPKEIYMKLEFTLAYK